MVHANREVVHDASWALVVKRNQCLGDSEAHDFVLLVLAHRSKTEKLLVEIDGTLQVVDLNADVIDFYAFETGLLKPGDSRAARRGKHRQSLDQFSPRECSFFETCHKIGNHRFHAASFRLHVDCFFALIESYSSIEPLVPSLSISGVRVPLNSS